MFVVIMSYWDQVEVATYAVCKTHEKAKKLEKSWLKDNPYGTCEIRRGTFHNE